MTGTEEPWIEEAFSEADKMEVEKLKGNAEVTAIISGGKSSFDTIEVNGISIRFTPFVSSPVRHKLTNIRNKGEVSDEELVYLTLSLLSKDDPWNKPLTWKFIDASGGDASEALAKMMSKVAKRAEQMRTFQ